jgi:hypothetical protein
MWASRARAAIRQWRSKRPGGCVLEGCERGTRFPLQLAAPDAMEDKFRLLEGNSVDDELSKMKQDLLKGQRPKAQLPEGRPIRDAIDWELEELRRRARE